jgi:3-oxoacyl-[acyl-carrier-protein] synthase II
MSAPSPQEPRRVGITGIGLVTSLGVGRDENWKKARAGESGLGRPTASHDPNLPVQVVGEVEFQPTDFISKKLMVRSDRNTHFAFAACIEALADAVIDPEQEDKTRVGLVLASNYGGLSYYLENLTRLHQRGPSFVSAYMAVAWIPSAPVGQLSIFYGFTGYSKTLINDSAGGLDAIGAAYAAVRRGDSDVIVAGGFEAALADAAVVCLGTFDEICKDAPDPATAYRPFDSERYGVVIAEGGAIVILEELERARARGAPVYAEVTGFAQTSDAVDLKRFAPDGEQYARAMRLALEQSGVTGDQVDYVSADGRATLEGDRSEAKAIHRSLNEHGAAVAVSAPKAMTGNTLAGAGAIDTAFTALAIREEMIPPTINIDEQDPELGLRIVANEAEQAQIRTALVLARGTGGVNSALVLGRPDGAGS